MEIVEVVLDASNKVKPDLKIKPMGNDNRSNGKLFKSKLEKESKNLKRKYKLSLLKSRRQINDAKTGPETRNGSILNRIDFLQTSKIISKPKRPYHRRIPVQNGELINVLAKPLRRPKFALSELTSSKQTLTTNHTSLTPAINVHQNRLLSKSVSANNSSSIIPPTQFNDWNNNKFNTLRIKHEAFVRSFAIPTHLYRYLSQRHRDHPLFLDRTLGYLNPHSFNRSKTTKSKRRHNLNTIVDQLKTRQNCTKLPTRNFNKGSTIKTNGLTDNNCNSLDFNLSLSQFSPIKTNKWPQELELSFEGFYDSEKELDWATVEASVNVYLRFGWAWRRKVCPSDTLINVTPDPINLTTHHHGRATTLTHAGLRNNASNSRNQNRTTSHSCRFILSDLIKLVKWNVSGGRLTSAQLELHITATEKRWLKRPDIQNNSVQSGSVPHNNDNNANESKGGYSFKNVSSTSGRKGSLGSVSYPVHYASAPLPLFSNLNKNHLSTDQPFLLTPGLYELRLGVDNSDQTELLSNSNGKHVPNGYVGGESAEMVQMKDKFGELNKSGTCSGRVEWRRIRFPKLSKAQDEYLRWPSIRFRVQYISPSQSVKTIKSPDLCKSKDNLTNCTNYTSCQPRSNSIGCDRNSIKNPISPRLSTSTHHHHHHPNQNNDCAVSVSSFGDDFIRSSKIEAIYQNSCPKQNLSHTSNLGAIKMEEENRNNSNNHNNNNSAISVTYCFVYGGNLQQWSEAKDLICPWCQLDCGRAREKGLEALLMHLCLCHPRFCFKPHWNSSRSHLKLDVSLNQSYDGSNDCGLRKWGLDSKDHSTFIQLSHCPLASNGQILGAWSGLGINGTNLQHHQQQQQQSLSLSLIKSAVRYCRPIRRLPFTHLIFWRCVEQAVNQFLDPTLSVRPMVIGHNRVYYHTRTAQPIRACEFDSDSEAEDAPVWLCQHYQRKVEEFTDVNQGEKQIMQMWNAHLLSIRPFTLVVCDSQIVTVLSQFIYLNAHLIDKNRLRINLLLHLVNLCDYGLLSSALVRQFMVLYAKRVSDPTEPPSSHPIGAKSWTGKVGSITDLAKTAKITSNPNKCTTNKRSGCLVNHSNELLE